VWGGAVTWAVNAEQNHFDDHSFGKKAVVRRSDPHGSMGVTKRNWTAQPRIFRATTGSTPITF